MDYQRKLNRMNKLLDELSKTNKIDDKVVFPLDSFYTGQIDDYVNDIRYNVGMLQSQLNVLQQFT
jgi:hypothetical protein